MDFGTIRKKLTHNVYTDINEFIRDMNLVFNNCIKYNGMENLISKYALEIKNTFEENMKQMGYMSWFYLGLDLFYCKLFIFNYRSVFF